MKSNIHTLLIFSSVYRSGQTNMMVKSSAFVLVCIDAYITAFLKQAFNKDVFVEILQITNLN